MPGVETIDVDLDSKLVTVNGSSLDDAALIAAIEEAGYEATTGMSTPTKLVAFASALAALPSLRGSPDPSSPAAPWPSPASSSSATACGSAASPAPERRQSHDLDPTRLALRRRPPTRLT